jgi:hypothetical protein
MTSISNQKVKCIILIDFSFLEISHKFKVLVVDLIFIFSLFQNMHLVMNAYFLLYHNYNQGAEFKLLICIFSLM